MAPKKKAQILLHSRGSVESVDAVEKGQSVKAAIKLFGFPQSALAFKVSGKPLLKSEKK